MKSGTITDLCNLKFFYDAGTEIYTEQQYTITWKLESDHKRLNQVPGGFILGDIEKVEHIARTGNGSDFEYYRLKPDSLVICFTKNPEIILTAKEYRHMDNQSLQNLIHTALCTTRRAQYSKVIVSVKSNDNTYSTELAATLFFDEYSYKWKVRKVYTGDNDTGIDDDEHKVIISVTDASLTICDDRDLPADKKYCLWEELDPRTNYTSVNRDDRYFPDGFHQYLYYILEPGERAVFRTDPNTKLQRTKKYAKIDPYDAIEPCKIRGIAQLFPFIKYAGSLTQETISAGFTASNTLIVLEEVKSLNDDGIEEISFERPAFREGDKWQLAFECPEEGELKILETTQNYELVQNTSCSYLLGEGTQVGNLDKPYIRPFTFAIGVIAPEEGCYQNYLGMYMRMVTDPDLAFFMGMLVIKTEVVQEDTRFRTLLENFGIPDPKQYSGIFAESNYHEALDDYDLINRKSKELMLTYDQIFPFAGTYKGLVNALKFLGYTDILLKEWYKIFDNNGQERDVAFDSVDIQNGKLGEMLDKFHNSDTRKYTKLDYITMVYHLNQVIEKDEIPPEETWQYTPGTETDLDRNNSIPALFDVQETEPIYAYRTDEITAKLYALKKWLETYILGVGARIVNITGEGVYFGPMKSQIYATSGMVQDFETEAHVTPTIVGHTPFVDSKSEIECTICEFDRLEFKDLGLRTFGAYTQNTILLSVPTKGIMRHTDTSQNITLNNSCFFTLSLSNPVSVPVIGDEYQFELTVSPESMSLKPWMCHQMEPDIIVEDDMLRLTGYSDAVFTDPGTKNMNWLPTFILETANIRRPNGTWETNVEWMIQERIDNATTESVYLLQNLASFAYASPEIRSISHILLKPGNDPMNCTCCYSCNNKWGVPLLCIRGYQFDLSEYEDETRIMSQEDIGKWFNIPEDEWYILEIVRGRMMQSGPNSVQITLSDGSKVPTGEVNPVITKDMSYEIMFDVKYDQMQQSYVQSITPTVTYIGERTPVYNTRINMQAIQLLNGRTQTAKIQLSDVYNFIISHVRFAGMDKYYLDYIDTNKQAFNAIREHSEWLLRREMLKLEGSRIKTFMDLIHANITTNKTTKIPVHHIGSYNATVKMYDRYNNIYVNKTSRPDTISIKPYDISLTLNQPNSSNSGEFFSENIQGEEILEVYQECQMIGGHKIISYKTSHGSVNKYLPESIADIKFPAYYDLYDIQNNTLDYNNLYFWNYSYANKVPKEGDQILLGNRYTRIYTQKLASEYFDGYQENLIGFFDYGKQQEVMFRPGDSIIIFKYDNKLAELVHETGHVQYLTGTISRIIEHDPEDEKSVKLHKHLKFRWPHAEKYMAIKADGYDDFIEAGAHYYMISTTKFDINLDCISSSENGYMNCFHIPGETGTQRFQRNNVIRVDYTVIEHPYTLNTIQYTDTKYLHNALYDAGYPSLYVKFKNGQVQEHQYCRVKDKDINRDVVLKYDKEMIEYAYMFVYVYDPESWTVYDITNYIKKTAIINGVKWEVAKDIIYQTNEVIMPGDPLVVRSTNITFDRYYTNITVKFPGTEIKETLHNSVSYRIVNVTSEKKMVQNKGMLPEYTYILDGSLDTEFMENYSEHDIYETKVTVSYPYQEFCQYIANVTQDGQESTQDFGTHNYSMIRTDFKYDADSMLLDSYIDQSFIGRIFEFDPTYLKKIWVEKAKSLTALSNDKIIPLFKYVNHPISVNSGTEIVLQYVRPEKNDPFKSVYDMEWAWEANLYDDSDYLEEMQYNRFRHHTVFKCKNDCISIRPDTQGVNDVILTVYDNYGNRMIQRNEALVYIR